jgi:hypothetical protein
MILAIGPDHCQTWRGRRLQRLQDVGSGYRIVEGGTADKDDQQQPPDIDTDVAFAALDFLAAILATLATLFGRLHRLTIDTRSTGGGLLRGRLLFANLGAQCLHHLWPRAIVSPRRKVCIDGALGQQIVWQHVPLAPCAVEVQDSVDDCAHVHRSRSPAGLRWGKKRLQDMPLIIG